MVAVIPLHTVFRGKIGHGTLIPGTIERWKGILGFSRGVTGAAGAAAAWGALFTAQTRCSRKREAWSIFFVSNFLKDQFGVSLSCMSHTMRDVKIFGFRTFLEKSDRKRGQKG